MSRFLAEFALTLLADAHAVMILDGAGWHARYDLESPNNVSLLRLPLYAPDFKPVKRVGLFVVERHR